MRLESEPTMKVASEGGAAFSDACGGAGKVDRQLDGKTAAGQPKKD
jgi:hypothetical protein